MEIKKKKRIYFASNIRTVRSFYDFTFSDLAKLFKVSSRQVQNWAYGKSPVPDVPTAIRITDSLSGLFRNGDSHTVFGRYYPKPTLDDLFFMDFRSCPPCWDGLRPMTREPGRINIPKAVSKKKTKCASSGWGCLDCMLKNSSKCPNSK